MAAKQSRETSLVAAQVPQLSAPDNMQTSAHLIVKCKDEKEIRSYEVALLSASDNSHHDQIASARTFVAESACLRHSREEQNITRNMTTMSGTGFQWGSRRT